MDVTLKKYIVGKQIAKILLKQKAVIAIALLLLAMMFSGTNFFTTRNFITIFRQASPMLIIGMGVTFAVICRACDLSVGSVFTFSGIVAILLINNGVNMYLAILLGILSGSAIGFINGFLVVHQKSEAFIITLGMGMFVKGGALFLTNANPVPLDIDKVGWDFMNIAETVTLGLPNLVWWMIVLLFFTFFLLRFTSFGRNCYALGGDYDVAKYSGINVVRTKWLAFVLSGTYAAIAGVLIASSTIQGAPLGGDAIPLEVNCGVVIGGTSFAGGIGGAFHSFVGIMVMQLIQYCLGFFGINAFIRRLILGILIVSIICMDCYTIKRKKEDV